MAKHRKLKDSNIKSSSPTMEYWEKVNDFIYACGDFSAAIKLYDNFRDPDTKDKVDKVVDDYYGDIDTLWDTIQDRRKTCLIKIDKLNTACKANGIRLINSPEALIELMLSNDRREYYRRAIKRYCRRDIVIPLQQIESEYRELIAKRKQKAGASK